MCGGWRTPFWSRFSSSTVASEIELTSYLLSHLPSLCVPSCYFFFFGTVSKEICYVWFFIGISKSRTLWASAVKYNRTFVCRLSSFKCLWEKVLRRSQKC